MSVDGFSGPPTDGPSQLPAPRGNGLFAGPNDAPDRFELLGEGIRGGEGVTWRARYQGALRSPVPLAIKLLDRPRDTGPVWPSPDALQRWTDQLMLLQNVHLEHVVAVHEIFVGPPPHGRQQADQDAGRAVYVSMEWVDGPTIAELCGGKPATAATLSHRLQYVADVATALHEMHTATRDAGNPAVHRDLKPGNCIVHPGRGVVLIDLSGMRTVDDFDPTGLHTAAYTAPEVLRRPHARRETASDRYALGALAVFCLTGEDPPPAGVAATDRIAPRLEEVARAAGVAQVDAFVAVLLAMLRADPASRPEDGRAWAADLRRLAAPGGGVAPRAAAPGRRSRRRATVVALSALAVLAAGGTALAMPGTPWRPSSRAGEPTPAGTVTTGAAAVPGRVTSPVAAPSASAPALPGGSAGVPPPTSGASRPVTATSTVVTGRPRPTTAPATSRASVVTTTGAISSPANGTAVQNCAYFSGTARLASGRTLILAMRNLDNGDPNRYVETVFGWDKPAQLGSWRGAQYFGGAAGQRYRVELMSVDLAAARAADRDVDATNALASVGTRLASREVVREEGNVGHDCVGP